MERKTRRNIRRNTRKNVRRNTKRNTRRNTRRNRRKNVRKTNRNGRSFKGITVDLSKSTLYDQSGGGALEELFNFFWGQKGRLLPQDKLFQSKPSEASATSGEF